jgi:hypothetical protein
MFYSDAVIINHINQELAMTIYETIEICWLERHNLTDEIRFELAGVLEDDQLYKACMKFLKGIGSRHQVPGRVVHVFMGMCDWYREHEEYTVKQRRWIIEKLIEYWDQVLCEVRAEMML